ncbi:hypothetical protein K457DRAFT_656749 [Linnemannia elongata AG-77]|uniref:Uncharacterized protein n=1 Tax=Linnemannia elongata AG-77 TaxID=1314771 RepID=A0A197KDP4_9FUNG|nr:hypothetical protein K457DRAFT_656749 [Linnemannia elongata AG-77]
MPTRMRMRTAILVFGFWFLVGCFVLPALTFVLVSDLPFLVDPSHGLFALQLRAHTIPSFRPQRLSRFVCPFLVHRSMLTATRRGQVPIAQLIFLRAPIHYSSIHSCPVDHWTRHEKNKPPGRTNLDAVHSGNK